MSASLLIVASCFLGADEKKPASPAPFECGHLRSAHFDRKGDRLLCVTQRGELLYWSSRGLSQPVVIPLEKKPDGGIFDRAPMGTAYHPDGRQVILFYHDGRVQVWDVEARQKVKDLPSNLKGLSSARLSPDGARVACRSRVGGRFEDTGKVLLWNTRDWTPAGVIECNDCIYDHCFSPDGRQLILAVGYPTDRKNNGFTGIVAIDIETKQEVGSIEYGIGFPGCIAISSDGRWIATGGGDAVPSGPNARSLSGHLRIFDWNAKKLHSEPYTLPSDYVRAIAFSPDGKRLYSGSYFAVSGPYQASLRSFSAANDWKQEAKVELGKGNPHEITVAPDGRTVLVLDSDGLQSIEGPAPGAATMILKFRFYPEDKEYFERATGKTKKK